MGFLDAVSIVVPAAGKGVRFGAEIPKQYLRISGKPILQHTLERLLSFKPSSLVLVVAKNDDLWREIPATKGCIIAYGGITRADSVENGLQVLDDLAPNRDDHQWVMVHDCVRPCIAREDVEKLFDAVSRLNLVGGLLATPVTDTLKKVGGNSQPLVEQSVPREDYWLAQTPQMFGRSDLLEALIAAKQSGIDITDEASCIESLGKKPLLVQGSKNNLKVTTREDLVLAEFILKQQEGSM